MAYNRAAPKKQQNETLAVAAICLILGYLACWCIQVPAKPKVSLLAQSKCAIVGFDVQDVLVYCRLTASLS